MQAKKPGGSSGGGRSGELQGDEAQRNKKKKKKVSCFSNIKIFLVSECALMLAQGTVGAYLKKVTKVEHDFIRPENCVSCVLLPVSARWPLQIRALKYSCLLLGSLVLKQPGTPSLCVVEDYPGMLLSYLEGGNWYPNELQYHLILEEVSWALGLSIIF